MSSRVTFDNNKKYIDGDAFGPDSTPKIPATPIDIPAPSPDEHHTDRRRHAHKTRRRRDSEASSSLSSLSESFSTDSVSPTTPPPEPSPTQENASPDVATSPILSYFMAHASPIKSAHQFSFRDKTRLPISPGGGSFEDIDEGLPHVLHHARRMSHNWDQTKTIGVPKRLPPTESQQERNNSLMRRLSLSGSAQRPPVQSLARSMDAQSFLSQAPVPVERSTPTPPRRSATISSGTMRRPPSPMGERMLKGDFHGF